MNNGQPPYGDPKAWNQQGNQVNPAQYPVQQNNYVQQGYPQQPVYNQEPPTYTQPWQPVETYQQQVHPQQQAYQQQGWQPYNGQAQTPQQPWQQPGPQPQQFYGQQAYQQTAYQQTGYQQPQQQSQQAYPQFNQMGQQVQQQGYSGYSGYYSQAPEKKFELPLDVIGKAVLFGVLPVLFLLAMIFAGPVLKWIFLAGAVGGIILMWMKDVVSPNMRLTMSLVLGVMAVAALVGALAGPAADPQNDPGSANTAGQHGGAVMPSTATPTIQPTATPAPEAEADGAAETLLSFFYYWSVGNDEEMLARTAPSWRTTVDDPATALFVLLLNRTPQADYTITNATGTDNDVLRTLTVKVTIDKNDGRNTMDRYAFKVIMKKEDGMWYVDPQSLASNEKETATETVASANTTPTQPPLYTGTPDTILYYNARGGSRYHLNPECQSVGKQYLPMASFRFLDLDKSPYNELIPCNECGAPIPDDE